MNGAQEGLLPSVSISHQCVPRNPIRILETLLDSKVSPMSSEGHNLAKTATFSSMVLCKKGSVIKDNECMSAAIPLPRRAEIAEVERTKLFMGRCYKVVTIVSTDVETSAMLRTILYAGADPNLVMEDVLQT